MSGAQAVSQVQWRTGEKELESYESGSMHLREHTGEKGLSSSPPRVQEEERARWARIQGHSPLTCGGEQESDTE